MSQPSPKIIRFSTFELALDTGELRKAGMRIALQEHSRANACKTCMALVNGEVEYTCIAKLTPGTITVEPLPKRRLIRDLVTDTVPDDEKL